MPVLAVGKVFRSSNPGLRIDNTLPAGRYRFRLTVVDNDRNESAPAELVVTIARPRRPRRTIIAP